MYPSKHFTESRLEILVPAMRDNSFATVVTSDGDRPLVSHVPVTIEEGAGGVVKIRGHVARANPQWQSMAGRGCSMHPSCALRWTIWSQGTRM